MILALALAATLGSSDIRTGQDLLTACEARDARCAVMVADMAKMLSVTCPASRRAVVLRYLHATPAALRSEPYRVIADALLKQCTMHVARSAD